MGPLLLPPKMATQRGGPEHHRRHSVTRPVCWLRALCWLELARAWRRRQSGEQLITAPYTE